MTKGVSLIVCLSLLVSKTDAHYAYGSLSCQFISEDGHDALYTIKIYYNKQLLASYNSTEGKYRGYTEKAKDITDGLNHNQQFLDQEKKNFEQCRNGVSTLLTFVEAAAQEPQVRVSSTKTANSHQPGIIICSAYNFYPKPISLTWLRNGEEVTSEVISTDEMSDGHWLYQKHSYLEYIPTATDTIECMVEHTSLSKPKLYKWECLLESRTNKITVGTAGLVLGLAFITAGTIYYIKRKRDRVLVLDHYGRDEQRCGNY